MKNLSSSLFFVSLVAPVVMTVACVHAQGTRGSETPVVTGTSNNVNVQQARQALQDIDFILPVANTSRNIIVPMPKPRTAAMIVTQVGRGTSGLPSSFDQNQSVAVNTDVSSIETPPPPRPATSAVDTPQSSSLDVDSGVGSGVVADNSEASNNGQPVSAAVAKLPTDTDATDEAVATEEPLPPEPYEVIQNTTLSISGTDRELSGIDHAELDRFIGFLRANANGRLSINVYPDAVESDESLARSISTSRLLSIRRYLIAAGGTDILERTNIALRTASVGSAQSGRVLVFYRP